MSTVRSAVFVHTRAQRATVIAGRAVDEKTAVTFSMCRAFESCPKRVENAADMLVMRRISMAEFAEQLLRVVGFAEEPAVNDRQHALVDNRQDADGQSGSPSWSPRCRRAAVAINEFQTRAG